MGLGVGIRRTRVFFAIPPGDGCHLRVCLLQSSPIGQTRHPVQEAGTGLNLFGLQPAYLARRVTHTSWPVEGKAKSAGSTPMIV